ncbi:MAG: sulfatase [Acidobacteriota bacterium]
MISRRELFRRASSLVLASPAASVANLSAWRGKSAAGSKPNVLLILTDQQTLAAMSSAGNPFVQTPSMDYLAQKGVRFARSYCTAPICGPSRSSLVSGCMPHETGVNWNEGAPAPETPNLGQCFREAGYRTAWAGKWHLPGMYPHKFRPEQKEVRGFELLPLPFDYSSPRWMWGNETDAPVTNAALNFLQNHPGKEPFLLSVSYHNPHDICFFSAGPADFPPLPQETSLPPLPANHEPSQPEPEFVQQRRLIDHYGHEVLKARGWSEEQWRAYIYYYYRLVERVDAEIGKLISLIQAQGLADRTLVVFTSDHGEGLGAHRWPTKLCFYEEAIAVPFVLSLPGQIPQGKVDGKHLVSGLDLVPTVCDYAGVSIPPRVRGASLRAILDDRPGKWRESLVVELADDNRDKTRKGRAVITERYKYAVYSGGANREQLFDRTNDPGEMKNLAFEPRMKEIREAQLRHLRSWIQETNDDFQLGT